MPGCLFIPKTFNESYANVANYLAPTTVLLPRLGRFNVTVDF